MEDVPGEEIENQKVTRSKKNRVRFADSEVTIPLKKGEKTSSFLITINPNRVFHSQTSQGYITTRNRLAILGNWILEKGNLLTLLKFTNDWPRETNLGRVVRIEDDRVASIEWGSKLKMLHMHIYVTIIHATSLQIDCDKIRLVGSKVLGIPSNKFHVNVKGSGINFKNYVMKNVK